jgi:hypothetical protein
VVQREVREWVKAGPQNGSRLDSSSTFIRDISDEDTEWCREKFREWVIAGRNNASQLDSSSTSIRDISDEDTGWRRKKFRDWMKAGHKTWDDITSVIWIQVIIRLGVTFQVVDKVMNDHT